MESVYLAKWIKIGEVSIWSNTQQLKSVLHSLATPLAAHLYHGCSAREDHKHGITNLFWSDPRTDAFFFRQGMSSH